MKNYFVRPNDPILVKVAKAVPIGKIESLDIQNSIEKMLNIGYDNQKDRKKGVLVGLAAPQIGISKRIILVDVGADGRGDISDLRVYINPEVVWESHEKEEWYEGCFSTAQVCGIVERPKSIKIRAYTQEGKKVEEEYSGYVARIFQHEVDHLNGIEFIRHITDDSKLHWVEGNEFPLYRDKEAWRNWPKKCSRIKWEEIKYGK